MAVKEPNRVKLIREELLDSLDYEETCDTAKAARVITLTRQLLLVRHDSAGHAGSSFSNSPEKLQKLQEDARLWLRIKNRGGATTTYMQPSCYFRG